MRGFKVVKHAQMMARFTSMELQMLRVAKL
jgi:hypothetical protein